MNNRQYGLAVEPLVVFNRRSHIIVDRQPGLEPGCLAWANGVWSRDLNEARSFETEEAATLFAWRLYQLGHKVGTLRVRVEHLANRTFGRVMCGDTPSLYLTEILWHPYYEDAERAESRWSSLEDDSLRFDNLADIGRALHGVIEPFRRILTAGLPQLEQ
jgi:hypothetical protein